MAILKREYICPYCFTKHKINNVKFRCSNEDHVEEDTVYKNYWKVSRILGKVIQPVEKKGVLSWLNPTMPETASCDGESEKCKNSVTRTRICPTCHSTLPSTIADYEDYIFAIIGAKDTGKSHFISILIERINNEIGNVYNCFLQPGDDSTIRRYKENFYNPLFKNKVALNVTRSASEDDEVNKPLLYTLSINGEGVLGKKVITLAFFDTAGEDLNDELNMIKHNRYICNSSGIICLLDPLQLEKVREQLQGQNTDVDLPSANPETGVNEVLMRTTNMIRNTLGIEMKKKITIPMALSFSKIDAIQPLLDPSSHLNQKSKHTNQNGFDIVDFENINNEMEGLVREWSRGNIPQLLEHNYKVFAYFGVSALGHDPGPSKVIKDIVPYRVEDPFLWLLWKNGIIKGNNRK